MHRRKHFPAMELLLPPVPHFYWPGLSIFPFPQKFCDTVDFLYDYVQFIWSLIFWMRNNAVLTSSCWRNVKCLLGRPEMTQYLILSSLVFKLLLTEEECEASVCFLNLTLISYNDWSSYKWHPIPWNKLIPLAHCYIQPVCWMWQWAKGLAWPVFTGLPFLPKII